MLIHISSKTHINDRHEEERAGESYAHAQDRALPQTAHCTVTLRTEKETALHDLRWGQSGLIRSGKCVTSLLPHTS